MHNIKTSYLIRESRAGGDEKMKSSTINLNFSSSLDSLQMGKTNIYKRQKNLFFVKPRQS